MSWGQDGIPDLVVMAGANGSGKTTFMRCVAQVARCLQTSPTSIPKDVDAEECLVDFSISDGDDNTKDVRFLVGSEHFTREHRTENSFGYARTDSGPKTITPGALAELRRVIRPPQRFAESTLPGVVFVPADDRDLVVPAVKYRAPGQLAPHAEFVSRWERLGQGQWSGSTLELMFSARWADLNAVAAGHPEQAVYFDRYAQAFNAITGARKNLVWTKAGELVVELDTGESHPIEDLSAGERQLLLLLAELRRLWRPGSLILIDEPELHLHDHWQGRLLDVLEGMQKELGGQVILATQSQSLFEMAGVGTRVILGRSAPR
jgi:ABC-type transport system involved in cytochrome c biogenesis ATPase subunit